MQNKHKILISAALAIGTVGAMGVKLSSPVFAESSSKYPPIVQKLIDKFNLNTGEVDKIMEQEKAERETQMKEMETKRQAGIENKLSQAVKDGKITEEQKTKILAKLAEMIPGKNKDRKEERVDFSKLTEEERKAKMEEQKTEMEQRKKDFEAWEKELGVKLSDILGSSGFGGFGGRGHMGDFPGEPPEAPKSN